MLLRHLIALLLLATFLSPYSVKAEKELQASITSAPIIMSCADKPGPVVKRFFLGVGKPLPTQPALHGSHNRAEFPLQFWYEATDTPGAGLPSYLVPRNTELRPRALPTAFGNFCGVAD